MTMNKVVVWYLSNPEHRVTAKSAGRLVAVLVNKKSGATVYMTGFPGDRVLALNPDFDDFSVYQDCSHCGESFDLVESDQFIDLCWDCESIKNRLLKNAKREMVGNREIWRRTGLHITKEN